MMYFEDYGELDWLEPEEYFAGNWKYRGTAEGDDEEQYDIVMSGDSMEFRYTIV